MTIEPSLFLYDMLRDTNCSLLPKTVSFRNLKYIIIFICSSIHMLPNIHVVV